MREALGENDAADRLRNNRIRGARGISSAQQCGFDGSDGIGRLQRPIKLPPKHWRQIPNRSKPSGQFMHRGAKHLRGSVRVKSNSHHAGGAIGPQQQRTANLAGEKTTRLPMPLPVLEELERLAQIEDKFRMAIGNHALRRDAFSNMLQRPKAIDERLQLARRPDFSITHHPGMIAWIAGMKKATLIALLFLGVVAGTWRVRPAWTATGKHRTYPTNFRLTENPISEGGNWINGKVAGLDWCDVATTPGLAFGVESGSHGYDDATAFLTGIWKPDQTAEATVHSVNQNDHIWEEVELRLRSTLSAHHATGYEINFRCSKRAKAYSEIVRWNGPLGNFTYLSQHNGSQYGVANGDVVKATIVGDVITVYINGVQINQARDSTYATGNPGMGFFLRKGAGVNRDYGFIRFTARDESR